MELHTEELVTRLIPGWRKIMAEQLLYPDQLILTKWSLHHLGFDSIFQHWGWLMINFFTPSWKKKIPSLEGAFQNYWNHLEMYTFLPFILIQKIINQVRASASLSIVLVVLLWQHLEWFLDLLSLLMAKQKLLSQMWNLLVQPHVCKLFRTLDVLNPHAWKLSSELRKFFFFFREMSACIRGYFCQMYQGRWIVFCDWCHGQNVTTVLAIMWQLSNLFYVPSLRHSPFHFCSEGLPLDLESCLRTPSWCCIPYFW